LAQQLTVIVMSDQDISQLIQELKELKLRELQVLSSLEALVQLQTVESTAVLVATDNTKVFSIGDSVVITNKVRRPLNRYTNSGDRTAVVTKVSTSCIDIKTTNGSHTWRAPHNLRFRTHDE
jgi:hypothetical protein